MGLSLAWLAFLFVPSLFLKSEPNYSNIASHFALLLGPFMFWLAYLRPSGVSTYALPYIAGAMHLAFANPIYMLRHRCVGFNPLRWGVNVLWWVYPLSAVGALLIVVSCVFSVARARRTGLPVTHS